MTRPFSFFAEPGPSFASLLGATGFPPPVDPTRVAVRWDSGELTYAELKDRALRIGQAFTDRGLRRGDVVAVLVRNRPEVLEILFACAYAGLTLVPINFRFAPEEVRLVLDDCRPKLLVTEDRLASTARAASARADDVELLVLTSDADDGALGRVGLLAADQLTGAYPTVDPLLMLYTSGTSGRPKAVVIEHQKILWHSMFQIAHYRFFDEQMVLLINGPFYNASGIYDLTLATFLVGGQVCVLPSGGWTPEGFARRIDEWQITHLLMYPSMIQRLLEADRNEPLPMESVKFVLIGGEALPAATAVRFMDRWDHFVSGMTYGLTEGGLVTYTENEGMRAKPESVGRAVVEIRIVGEQGDELPPGEIGEVLVGGGTIFSGYFNAPDLTAEAKLESGWLATGDLGWCDEDGYYYISGRKKDMIISGAQNIFPAEIEHVLSHHPAIREVAVIGVPDDQWGEAVCAVVVAEPGSGLTPQDVTDYARDHLASYKKPKHVVFLDELPRSSLTYVLKTELREQFIDIGKRESAGQL
jgi:fatty-acyl-CoA synthase